MKYRYEDIQYGYEPAARKWKFISPTYTLFSTVKGGNETASKIARLMRGGLIRTKGVGLDGLARKNIEMANK